MTQPVHIVGAGLVGPLMAVYLARKGFNVTLHERRPDMRKTKISAGRSINLALTARGIKSLDEVGLRDTVMKIAIPMKGRIVHDIQGNCDLQPYGQKEHEVIYAASRGLLNQMLLDAAEAHKNVRIFFDRRCADYDIDKGLLTFIDETSGREDKVEASVVVGADGSGSAIRKAMQGKVGNFAYSQSFLEYGYKELTIPPKEGGGFRIEPNALHIWPRHSYMMIALPNTEGSFTVTLFYPNKGKDSFEQLETHEAVKEFFFREFPDAAPHMPELEQDFFANPTGALVTVKCSPWNADGKAVLIGDAAHAIVPFFAQGMNSGFEDCAALNSLITSSSPDWKDVFDRFGQLRKPNADAIADMAVENFFEMRDSVTNPQFLLRKKVGFALEKRWPGKFIPRYSMVIFHPEIPYAEAQRRGALQDRILDRLCANISTPDQVDWTEAETLLRQMA
jgi:kynurenine 3-monooxygenase